MSGDLAGLIESLREQLGLQLAERVAASILIITGSWLLGRLGQRLLRRKETDPASRYRWQKTLRYSSVFTTLVLLGVLWIEGLPTLTTFLAVISAGLAVALRDLLVDLSGWLFIVWRHPFGLGDRIQIGTWAGDVVDIRWFQFTMLEIQNWVDADQSTGRVVHIPNGSVFREPLAKFSRGFAYIWNEIPVRLTFESDWRKAKALLQGIGERHSAAVSAEAERSLTEKAPDYLIFYRKFTPMVYTRGREFGVQLTLRYLCNPRERRGTEHAIWEDVLAAFAAEPEIQFAYPTLRVVERPEGAPGDGPSRDSGLHLGA
jgi:small-conductance mechanosensitive channel